MKRTHGRSGTRTYRIWCGMRRRCMELSNPQYGFYGGRGIKVCDRWLEFAAFLSDMGECPPGLTLDRIDNDGHYEPTNCRWATVTQQARNRRSNRVLHFNGESLGLCEWATRLSMRRATIRYRLDTMKWSVERALTEPITKGPKRGAR